MVSGSKTQLKRNLGLLAIVGLGLGYMTPTVVFDTFGIVSEKTNGAVPAAYLTALVVMMFTAVSYGKISRAIPSAGSAYTYVRESMHPNLGFMVGWTALIDYMLLPMVNALIIRQYLEQMVPAVPAWIWVVIYCIITSFIISLSMRGTAGVNGLLLGIAVVTIAVFVVVVVAQLLGGNTVQPVDPLAPFTNEAVTFSAVLAGATVVCFSFIGFDAVTMYSDEAKNEKIVPRAVLLTVLIGGGIFLVASYVTQLRFPTNEEFAVVDNTTASIGLLVGGPVFQIFFVAAAFAATFASGLASHASVSRMMLVMGRNGVLPRRFFGFVSPKTRTPVLNIVLVGAITLFAMSFSLELISAFINFGALIAFTFVNASVIFWFAVRKGLRSTPKDVFRYIVMPGIGVIMTGVLWVHLSADALIGGTIWAALGFIWLLILTRGFRKQVAGFDEKEPVTGFNKTAPQ